MQGARCENCPLHKYPTVKGGGAVGGLAIVGEAPGSQEVAQGRPFVGKSGKMLRETLTSLGVDPEDTWITNACLCHPPRNDTPPDEAIKSCRPRLLQELQEAGVTQIIALGNTAIQALVPGADGVTTIRGRWQWIEDLGVYLMPTYHPAALLRNPEGFRDFANDIYGALSMPTEKMPDPVPPPHVVCGSWWDVDRMVKHIKESKPTHVVCDIETKGYQADTGRMLCFGIASSETDIWIIPDHLMDDPFVRFAIKDLLEDQNIFWAGQNAYQFDVTWIDKHYGVNWRPEFDTMLAHYCLDERALGHSLKDQAAERYQAPDWDTPLEEFLSKLKKERLTKYKAEVRAYKKEYGKDADTSHIPLPTDPDYGDIPLEMLYPYLAYDCKYTWKLVPDLYNEMEDDGVLHVHNEILLPLAWALGELERVGTTIDIGYLRRVGGILDGWVKSSVQDLQMEVNTICESALKAHPTEKMEDLVSQIAEFNPNSHIQVATLIYDILGMKAPKKVDKRQKGTRGVDKITLGALNHPICKNIITHREKTKLKGTYVTGILNRLRDWRIYSDFLIFGTRTSRLSSSNPNLQNIPINAAGPVIRDAFIATIERWMLEDLYWKIILHPLDDMIYPGPDEPHPDGEWVLLESDYSQLELRVVGYFSGDAFLSETFKSGGDIHAAVATKVFHVTPEECTTLQRFLAKQINFGIIYGRQPKSLAQGELNCSVAQATVWYNEYMAQFSGLQEWIKETQARVLREGVIETAFGRKRRFPCITSANRSDVERIAINTPIQGTAADICNTGLTRIIPQLDPEYARPLLTVHDSIMYEVRRKRLPEVMAMVRYEMEDNCPIKADFPFVIDFKVGYRWGSLEKVKDIAKLDDYLTKARETYPRDTIELR